MNLQLPVHTDDVVRHVIIFWLPRSARADQIQSFLHGLDDLPRHVSQDVRHSVDHTVLLYLEEF